MPPFLGQTCKCNEAICLGQCQRVGGRWVYWTQHPLRFVPESKSGIVSARLREKQLYVGTDLAGLLKGEVGLASQLPGVLLKALAGPLERVASFPETGTGAVVGRTAVAAHTGRSTWRIFVMTRLNGTSAPRAASIAARPSATETTS